jgi:UDP-glucose:(heptosyl)LPS alpha-1,3-glucosyltransferase
MRFAFVVSLWFPFGGMQRSLLRIAQACVARGHAVDIFTGEWQGERPGGIGVFELDTRAATNHAGNDLLGRRFAEATARRGYDGRVGFTKLPGLDVYYAADPCYAERAAERSPFYRLLPRYRAFRRQEEAVFRPGAGTEVLLIAHQERERFIHHYGTEPGRFHLLPPGINRERILHTGPEARGPIRQEFGIPADETLLLAVGSRFHTKGIDRLIRALAALPAASKERCRLLVAGHGKEAAFRRLAQGLGVGTRVLFAGSRDDIPALYRGADLLLHAPRTENTGTVLLEAMLCGLPVLCTGNCGFAHHVRDAGALSC